MDYANIFLLLAICLTVCFAHTMPERREDRHLNGKHNSENDQHSFLSHDAQKEFDELDDAARKLRLSKLVNKIDTDGNRNISKTELAAWMKYISLKEPTDVVKEYWDKNIATIVDENDLISWESYKALNFPGSAHDNEIKQRIKRYEARFNAADENNDGKLSVGEFVAFQHLDLFPRMHDVFVEEIVETMDKNEDGKISYEEFIGDKKSDENAKREFNSRDLDKSGVLEKNEIKEWYFPSRYNIHENEADHLIQKADSNKDKVLTKEEILENFEIFVGSRVTHWGKTLKRHVDEL